jgi:DNA recombination protein RmuC
MIETVVIAIGLVLVILLIIVLVFMLRQQTSITTFQSQLLYIQESFLKETQSIKTSQLMQTNQWQEEMHHTFATHVNPLHQSLHSVSSMMGELHQMNQSVSQLKQVLSSEKSKGLLGEVSLQSILSSLLPSNAYTLQANHPSFDNNKVDALIRLSAGDKPILVPIDAKVPLQDYEAYVNDPTPEHWNSFIKAVKTQAKSIRQKYIRPPYTSEFALMYIPFESLVHDLYQDNHILHTIFEETKVYVVSPMTLHAFINVLMMSFKHHDIVAKSQIIIEHMSELTQHVNKSETLLDSIIKKQNDVHQSILTLSLHLKHIQSNIKGLEMSKNIPNDDEVISELTDR